MAGKSKKKFSVSGVVGSTPDINVTPLVDVVLVLLIIFMVVTPLMEKDIEVKVPDTEQQEDDQPQPPPDSQLVVGISAEGQIAINFEKIADEDYVARLTRMVRAKAQGDRLVFFMPDEKVNYGKLIAALDGARQAGAEILGMMTEVPAGGLQPAPEGGEVPPAPPTPPPTP